MSSSILFPTNEYAVSSKSSEEIQRLSMPRFERVQDAVAHIVAKGLPVQFPFVYKNVHRAHREALHVVCSKVVGQSAENQIIIAKSLIQLIRQKGATLAESDLEMIFDVSLECLNNLQSSANEEIGQLLQAVIEVYPQRKKLIQKLQEVALELGKPSQPIISKVTSGRLISRLAMYLGRTLKGEMIDIVKRVLSDNEVEVRKVWVIEIFPRLLKNLELEFIELHLQQKIYQTVWDESEEIAALALQSILENACRFSVQEQGSRIVKLFIDSLTSKRERIAVLASEMLGPAFKKLLNSILGNQQLCLRFWKSLIELAQSKNEKVLNNLAYNLPGVLMLSTPLYRVDPFCDVYVQLFYQPASNKSLLASYFHEVAAMFPSKYGDLREVAYWMLGQFFEDQQPCDESIKIVCKLLHHLPACKGVFLDGQGQQKHFDPIFCDYLIHFYTVLQSSKNSLWLSSLNLVIRDCFDCFGSEFVQSTLLPKLYLCLRSKPADAEYIVEAVVRLVTREGSSSLINTYTSKISVELTKSSKSYQRETALLFFYYATHYCSIDLFQEYRLGQKYLSFNTDKNFKVKTTFIRYLPRLLYFLTREEKIEYSIILSRLAKDSDYQIKKMMEEMNFLETQESREEIAEQSRLLKEREKEKALVLNVRKQNQNRRSSKQMKKEDILKKKIETAKSKTKILIKQVPKKKVGPVLVKTCSNFNFRKNS